MKKKIIVFLLLIILLSAANKYSFVVDRGCNITEFTMKPSAPYILGDNVILSGKSNCGTVKFEINGESRSETGQPNQTMTWNTNEWGSGNFDVCFVARGEGGWENADRNCHHVYVEGGQAPPSGSTNSGAPVKCWVNSFTITPNSVRKGEKFNLSGQGQCDGNARACRFSIDGEAFSEFGGYQNSDTLSTNDLSVGNHELCFIITGGDWSDAAKSCVIAKVTQDEQSSNDVVQGEQTTNDIAGQTTSSGPETNQSSSNSDTPQQNYLSRDVFGGWTTRPNESRVYIPSDIDRLRFRTGPGKNEDIMGYVQEENWYKLVSENSDWVEIETRNGTTGWLDKQYVRVDHVEPGSNPLPTATKEKPKVGENNSGSYAYIPFDDSAPNNQENSWSIIPQAYAADICDARAPITDDDPTCVQCVEYVQDVRQDVLCWLSYDAYAGKWAGMAQGEKAKAMGITVDLTPSVNDIVEWKADCDDVRPNGHVAIVTSVNTDGTINISESNGINECKYGTQKNIQISGCMSFIHEPQIVESEPEDTPSDITVTQTPPQTNNSQANTSKSLFCRIFGFIFPGKCGR